MGFRPAANGPLTFYSSFYWAGSRTLWDLAGDRNRNGAPVGLMIIQWTVTELTNHTPGRSPSRSAPSHLADMEAAPHKSRGHPPALFNRNRGTGIPVLTPGELRTVLLQHSTY